MNSFKTRIFSALAVGLILLGPSAFTAGGEAANEGGVTSTVHDPGAVRGPAAVLELKAAGTNGVGGASGTWNNLPGGAVVSADFDGTPGISNRFRSGGFNYGTTAVQPRIEDVAEMTIQTAQVDLSGIGTSAMRISIVTRRGTNALHGRLYADFRNHVLNANSWINNARNQPRNILKLNDFGASVGGPILKNKLFFFGTWAESIQPFSGNLNAVVLSPAAQQGLFSYKDSGGALQTINLLQVAGTGGLPSKVNANVASSLQAI